MYDKGFSKIYGEELDSIAEEIFDGAGSYDVHWDILVAAANLIKKERDKIEKINKELELMKVKGLSKRDPLWVQGWNECIKVIKKYLEQ